MSETSFKRTESSLRIETSAKTRIGAFVLSFKRTESSLRIETIAQCYYPLLNYSFKRTESSLRIETNPTLVECVND